MIIVQKQKGVIEMKEKTIDDFITFLNKELVELMFNGEISSDHMSKYHQIITKWKKQEENKDEKR